MLCNSGHFLNKSFLYSVFLSIQGFPKIFILVNLRGFKFNKSSKLSILLFSIFNLYNSGTLSVRDLKSFPFISLVDNSNYINININNILTICNLGSLGKLSNDFIPHSFMLK
jgi:hypothetical protein